MGNSTKYQTKSEIQAKWIKINRNLISQNPARSDVFVLAEAYDFASKVFSNVIDSYKARYDGETPDASDEQWSYFHEISKKIKYNTIVSFFDKVDALKQIGYPIPNDLEEIKKYEAMINDTVTVNGDDTTHTLSIGDDVKKIVRYIGEALVAVYMLDKEDLNITFEKLRIKIGEKVGYAGEYTVDSFIASSGSCRVYLGTHQRLKKKIVIKELTPNSYSEQLIDNERGILVSIRHAQIPIIYDVIYQNGTCYIIMDYINGDTLDKYLATKALTVDEKIKIILDICEVISFLHTEYGIIHADIKPKNVMMDANGKAVVIDFGVSNQASNGKNIAAVSKGYTAPEILKGEKSNVKSDIYSLGMLIKAVFDTGKTDFGERSNYDYINQIIYKATNEFPGNRYDSVAELIQDLKKPNKVNIVAKNKKKVSPAVIIVSVLCTLLVFASVFVAIKKIKGGSDNDSKDEEISISEKPDSTTDMATGKTTEASTEISTEDPRDEYASEYEAKIAFQELFEQACEYTQNQDKEGVDSLYRSYGDSDVEFEMSCFNDFIHSGYPDFQYYTVVGDGKYFMCEVLNSITTGEVPNADSMWLTQYMYVSYLDGEWKFDYSKQVTDAVDKLLKDEYPTDLIDAMEKNRNWMVFETADHSWTDTDITILGNVDCRIFSAWQNEDGSVSVLVSIRNGTDNIVHVSDVTVYLEDSEIGEIVYATGEGETIAPHKADVSEYIIQLESVYTGTDAWNEVHCDCTCTYE